MKNLIVEPIRDKKKINDLLIFLKGKIDRDWLLWGTGSNGTENGYKSVKIWQQLITHYTY